MMRARSIATAAMSAPFLFSPAGAQARGYYAAAPERAGAKPSFFKHTTIWRCADGVCTAAKAPSRDSVMCGLAASEIGGLSASSINGKAFDAAALQKCNTKAG